MRDLAYEHKNLTAQLDSAVEILRDIASLQGSKTARRKVKEAGCDIAAHWLAQHGYALEDGGYIPGKGFENSVRSGPAAQDAGTATGTSSQPCDDFIPDADGGYQVDSCINCSHPHRAHDRRNQCDGCNMHLPRRCDIHYAQYANGEEYAYMYCTEGLYE